MLIFDAKPKELMRFTAFIGELQNNQVPRVGTETPPNTAEKTDFANEGGAKSGAISIILEKLIQSWNQITPSQLEAILRILKERQSCDTEP